MLLKPVSITLCTKLGMLFFIDQAADPICTIKILSNSQFQLRCPLCIIERNSFLHEVVQSKPSKPSNVVLIIWLYRLYLLNNYTRVLWQLDRDRQLGHAVFLSVHLSNSGSCLNVSAGQLGVECRLEASCICIRIAFREDVDNLLILTAKQGCKLFNYFS